jgi:hypothetical protein
MSDWQLSQKTVDFRNEERRAANAGPETLGAKPRAGRDGNVVNRIILRERRVTLDGEALSPRRSQALRNHSPTGFAWGYGGSGPSQLALAILLEVTSESNALRLYQDFKWDHVSTWPWEPYEQTIDIDIGAWLREKGET